MSRPRLLDLFACAGAASVGYDRAGFDVVGVELDPNRAKYHPYDVVVGDALEYVKAHGHEYDAIHASPPCQAYTRGNAVRRSTQTRWPRLIEPVRELLQASGKPYVIENVKDAGYALESPTWLCGCMFGLGTVDDDGVYVHVQRGRFFETSFEISPPRACDHSRHEWVAGAYGGARRDKYEAKYVRKGGYVPPNKAVVKRMLGIDHDMPWACLFEAIPPAYTEHVGNALVKVL